MQASSTATADSAAEPIVLVVDGSGSMVTKDAGKGLSRIAAARKAAIALVGAQPTAVPIGLVTYGTHSSSAQTAAARTAGCKDISVLALPTANDHDRVTSQVAKVAASGYTPIGAALTTAVGTLGSGPGRVVLVSDGMDTCTPPDPCVTAKQLVAGHPGLTISTVGFRTESAAGKQLSCIAAAGHGVFVTADDTSSLVRRLGATSDAAKAREVVTSTGLGSAQIGQSLGQVQSANPGFPDWASGTQFSGQLPGLTGAGKVITVIVWRDCSYYFDASRTLVGIDPGGSGTIDGIKPGSTPADVNSVYGAPLVTTPNPDGTYSVLYQADSAARTKYLVVYTGNPATGGTIIKVIYLCTCRRAVPATFPTNPSEWTVDPNTGDLGPLSIGMTLEDAQAVLKGNHDVSFVMDTNVGMSNGVPRDIITIGWGIVPELSKFAVFSWLGKPNLSHLIAGGAKIGPATCGEPVAKFKKEFPSLFFVDPGGVHAAMLRFPNGNVMQLNTLPTETMTHGCYIMGPGSHSVTQEQADGG